jgi:hypothetical protein
MVTAEKSLHQEHSGITEQASAQVRASLSTADREREVDRRLRYDSGHRPEVSIDDDLLAIPQRRHWPSRRRLVIRIPAPQSPCDSVLPWPVTRAPALRNAIIQADDVSRQTSPSPARSVARCSGERITGDATGRIRGRNLLSSPSSAPFRANNEADFADLLASIVPAARAARVDVIDALRNE